MNVPADRSQREGLCIGRLPLLLALLWLLPAAMMAQPFGDALFLFGPNQYVEIPSSPALNPTSAITIEVFAANNLNTSCQSFVGKDYTTSYWIGECDGVMKSYLDGTADPFEAGLIPLGHTVHLAMTYDGVNRKHYVDGELVGVHPETGALAPNSANLRFGSDVSYEHSPFGFIGEVRLWSVARTQAQLQQTMEGPITSALPGLIAVWPLNSNSHDLSGTHNGGAPLGGADFQGFPTGPCVANATTACFMGGRFEVFGDYNLYNAPAADGHLTQTSTASISVVPGGSDTSTNFWFFSADNWELLVKSVNACPQAYWLFAAATTNVHHRIVFRDLVTGVQRVYWSFAGPPAPAITDTSALHTCIII